MPQVFISHSSKGDPYAARLRDAVTDGLEARKYEVRVDMNALRPGQDWCPLLYQWLGECDAAVVLLNAAALDSAWVRREVNILMWRRALNPSFRVLPVLVGEVRSSQLRDKGFTDVLPVECLRVPAAEAGADDGAQALAAHVLREFADLPEADGGGDAGDAMRSWIARIAAYLRQTEQADALKRAARALGISGDDLRHVESEVGSCVFLAHQMIGTADGRLVSALAELAPHLAGDLLQRLIAQIKPTWVNAESARHLLPPAALSGHTVALNATYPDTADQFVARAVCLRLDLCYLKTAGGIPLGEDAAEEFTAECVDTVRDLLNFPPGVPADKFRARPGATHFLSVSVRGVRPGLVTRVVRELHRLFPWLVLILLTGESLPDQETLAQWQVDDLVLVTPELDVDEEILGFQLSHDLTQLPARLNGYGR